MSAATREAAFTAIIRSAVRGAPTVSISAASSAPRKKSDEQASG